MELRDYIRILRTSWLVIVLLTLVSIAAAAVFSILQTPMYNASTRVFVATQSGDSNSDLQQGNSFTQARVATYTELVSTPIVLLPVIAVLELDTSVGQLSQQITASAPLSTTLIEITASNENPVLAADIANAVSQSLTNVVEDIETRPGAEQSPIKLTRVQDASVPSSPISPRIPLNIGLGALIGLALGLGFAVLRAVLDTRVRNERDVELLTDVPILGGIGFDPKASSRPLIVQDDPRSPRAESFRTLRTNLQFVDIERKNRAFVITSSIETEGKSTTGANLSIAMADAGSKVLYVDADLRRPKVAEYLGIEGAVGLTDVLIGHAKIADAIQPWGRGKMFVLPAGQVPPNPSELLGSAGMHRLFVTLSAEFDAIIFDAPPLLPVTDAAILTKIVGSAILVAASGRVHKNQLTGALTTLQNVGADVAGVVMTMMPTRGPDAYGYARYGYYGYGAGNAAAVVPGS